MHARVWVWVWVVVVVVRAESASPHPKKPPLGLHWKATLAGPALGTQPEMAKSMRGPRALNAHSDAQHTGPPHRQAAQNAPSESGVNVATPTTRRPGGAPKEGRPPIRRWNKGTAPLPR